MESKDVLGLLYTSFLNKGCTTQRAKSDANDIVKMIPEPFFEDRFALSLKLQRIVDVLTEVNNEITKDL